MVTPAFKLVEDQLRSFFGRCCQELSAHHGDVHSHFIRPYFEKRKESPKPLSGLQYHQYCGILEYNLRVSKEEQVVRLFERHKVAASLPADLRYSRDLRNKYAHLGGIGEALSPREQFSDLVIVRRTVGTMLQLKQIEAADRELVNHLDQQLDDLLGLLTESSASKSAARDEVEANEKDAMAVAIADKIATLIPKVAPVPSTVADVSGSQQIAAEIASLRGELSDLRKESDMRTLMSRIGDLESAVLSAISAVGEHLVDSQDDSDENGQETVEADDGSSFDLEELLAALARTPGESSSTSAPSAPPQPRLLSPDEAREALVGLRRRIWLETGSSASSDGLLRKSLLDAFIRYRPKDEHEAYRGAIGALLGSVAEDQLDYLNDVLAITCRIERG